MCQCCFCLLFQYVSQSARKAAAIITYSPVSSSWFILGELPLELPRLHHLPALPPVTCLKQTSMPVLDPIAICLQPILNIYFPTFGKCNFTHQFSAGSNSHLLPLSLSLSQWITSWGSDCALKLAHHCCSLWRVSQCSFPVLLVLAFVEIKLWVVHSSASAKLAPWQNSTALNNPKTLGFKSNIRPFSQIEHNIIAE